MMHLASSKHVVSPRPAGPGRLHALVADYPGGMARAAQRYTGTRPGGRSARVRRAVLDASAAMLLSEGLDALTLAAVAQAAGVHHATVYRRWPTRSRLVLDTIIDLTEARVPAPPPSTGGVHGDLVEYFTPIVQGLRDPHVQALVRSLIALPEEEIAGERREYWRARHAVATAIIEAGVARGELADSIDPWHVVELIAGPIWMRMLITGDGVEDAMLEQLVSEALTVARRRTRGAAPRGSRARA